MASELVYLISGANRGIGLGLVKEVLKSSNAVVFAGARDPVKATELVDLAALHPSRLFVVKLVSADEENNKQVAEEIKKKYGRVDTLIANAATLHSVVLAGEVPMDSLRDHYEVNVIGPLALFQATQSLLKASQNPKFIPISSLAGSSLATEYSVRFTCYGSSKHALNYIAKRINYEYDWLICFPFSPGGVRTDMLDGAAKVDESGFMQKAVDEGSLSVEQSCQIMIQKIVNATRDEGGRFWQIDSVNMRIIELPW